MRKVILAYHSVSSDRIPGVLGSFPVSFERFKAQVKGAMTKGWHLASLSSLFEPVEYDTLYVMNDDGTTDWVRNVLPWCEEEGVPTTTAVVTGPWLEMPVYPAAHRLQIALMQPERTISIPKYSPEQIEYIDHYYFFERDLRRRYLKGANVILNDGELRQILGQPSVGELRLLSERFARPSEYKFLRHAAVCPHSMSHRAFGEEAVDQYIEDEVLPCMMMLLNHDLKVNDFFVLPMNPRFSATIESLEAGLKRSGFRGLISGRGEWDQKSYVIPRIDAKDVEDFLGLDRWEEE